MRPKNPNHPWRLSKSRPKSQPQRKFTRWSPTHEQELAGRLADICRGRDTHAAAFSLIAEWDRAQCATLLRWTDECTGESGWLGWLGPIEVAPVVRALFEQLHAWRERCEKGADRRLAKALAAGGGR